MKANYDFRGARRGAVVPAPPGKVRITIRLDQEIITWFKAQVEAQGGGNYQTMLNDTLRTHVAQRGQSLETVLRKVVREEMRRVS